MCSIVNISLTILSRLTVVYARALGENWDMDTSSRRNMTTISLSARENINCTCYNGTFHERPVDDDDNLMLELVPLWILLTLSIPFIIVLLFAVLCTNWLRCGPLLYQSRYCIVKDNAKEAESVDLDATDADRRAFENFKAEQRWPPSLKFRDARLNQSKNQEHKLRVTD
ncbi:hypothetical protein E8E14_012873 [Neopestalotiopsis sp. 37M]|nr:hypothetical protein E8E14_012873 [Neopestalotiopsis sp. 37M]